ncbi:hypothetical protein [Micromonospora carbonacea]|uniref:hypothetical protein n=1 Tax=Micromonospora carbonacea TaxID=47853 RepID=UPI0033E38794
MLSDPAAFHRFAEHEVVLPLVVISEGPVGASTCGSSTSSRPNANPNRSRR